MQYEDLTLLEILFMSVLIIGAISAVFGVGGFISDYLIPRFWRRNGRK